KTDSTNAAKPRKHTGPSEEVLAKRREIDKKFAKYSRDHIYVNLNGTNWIYNSSDPRFGGMQAKWFSRGIDIGFNWDFRIKGSRVSIAPGIAYSNTNIYSRSLMGHDSAGTYFTPIDYGSDTTAKINKVSFQYLEIPLELRIRTDPDRFGNCWKVAVGFKAGVRVDVHTKTKLVVDGATHVFVERRFADYNLFRCGPTLRVGYSFVNITAYYGLLNMFKPGLGPKANEFSVGLSFTAL
ncbi:MAG TPA: outer membrane beta-barrel protein, partial [Chitinophagales bacterium]|nr:outer membrane beta-barrel protein [Chitinophagales bacterium]